MENDVLVNSLRLKYKNKYVVVNYLTEAGSMTSLEVIAPVNNVEKKSFTLISNKIVNMCKSGVNSRQSVTRTLDRLVGVDNDVLFFMKKIVKENLPLV